MHFAHIYYRLLFIIYFITLLLPNGSDGICDCGEPSLNLTQFNEPIRLKFPVTHFSRNLNSRGKPPPEICFCNWTIGASSSARIDAQVNYLGGLNGQAGFPQHTLILTDAKGQIKNLSASPSASSAHFTSENLPLRLEFAGDPVAVAFQAEFVASKVNGGGAREAVEANRVFRWWYAVVALLVALLLLVIPIFALRFMQMKKKVVLARIFRLLTGHGHGPKSSSTARGVSDLPQLPTKAKKHSLPISSHYVISLGPNGRRLHRTSTSSHLSSHFEPMPTILEEEFEGVEEVRHRTGTI